MIAVASALNSTSGEGEFRAVATAVSALYALRDESHLSHVM